MTPTASSRNDDPVEFVGEEMRHNNSSDDCRRSHTNEEEEEKDTKHEEEEEEERWVGLQSWLHNPSIPISKMIDPDFWPPRNTKIYNYYDWTLPTDVMYKDISIPAAVVTPTTEGAEGIVQPTAVCENSKHSNDSGNDDTDGKEEEGKEVHATSHSSSSSLFEFVTTGSTTTASFTPAFCEARRKLDYTYHTHVVKHRQYLQDAIIQRIVSFNNNSSNNNNNMNPSLTTATTPIYHPQRSNLQQHHHRPWIVFTAGPMGVGKGYVITQLQQQQLFNVRDHFITIDPDLIKYELPEMVGYLQMDRTTAATKVHRESTQISDIIFEYAIHHSLSVLVDGSLRDVNYYEALFGRIRNEYTQYRIAIIHITASRDVIYERATSRANRTGRVIPLELLEASIEQVPKSVAHLSPLADAVHVIANHPHEPIQLVSSTIRKTQPLSVPSTTTGTSINNKTRSNNNSGSMHSDAFRGDIVTTTTFTWKEFAESWDLPCVNNNNNNSIRMNDSSSTETTIVAPELVTLDSTISCSGDGKDAQPIENDTVKDASSLLTTIDHLPTQSTDTNATIAESSSLLSSSPSIPQDPTSTTTTSSPATSSNTAVLHNCVSMSKLFDDHPTHVVANAIWQTSYPNFCARCALVTDEQCGICIHNVHICACMICSSGRPVCMSVNSV